jgi:dGTPase
MLAKEATKNDDLKAIKRKTALENDGFRNEFERDYTRILHSRAFRRMRHKTQVFIRPENDHICTRLEHSLYVASISRTIAKKLELNTDLVQAIALGHDLGHAPFGHEGEKFLNQLGADFGIIFKHELHSLKVIDKLDSPYNDHTGLNLTFAVRDGIACHNGENFEQRLKPEKNKNENELECMKALGPSPSTMEGCVVRFADKIAYLGRDLEDAEAVGIVNKEEIPNIIKKRIGITNREVIHNLISDIVKESKDKNYIGISDKIHEAFLECKEYNYTNIYHNKKVTKPFKNIKHAVDLMFKEFTEVAKMIQQDEKLGDDRSDNIYNVLAEFIKRDIRKYELLKPEEIAIFFIAGMTDNYFLNHYIELFLPQNTV